MTGARSRGKDALRLLNKAAGGLIFLDDQFRIVHVNAAFASLVHLEEDQLLGQACQYHSLAANYPSAVAAAICPPPSIQNGRGVRGVVQLPSPQADTTPASAVSNGESWSVHFLPLVGEHAELQGVLIAFEDPSSRQSAAAHGQPNARDAFASLHDQLARLHAELAQLPVVDVLAGVSPASAKARVQAHVAAGCGAHVLLIGPAGIGKSAAAETIVRMRPTPNPKGLISVDCRLLTPEALEQALLASMPSGSDSALPAQAGGSHSAQILLRRVDELSEAGQTIVWEFLQRTPAESCIVYSTALEPLARHAPFRQDLAHALSPVQIELPSLSVRVEDIPLLAQALLEQQNATGRRTVEGFLPEVMERLLAFPWTGQLRQLETLVQEMHGRASGAWVTSDDLPEFIRLAEEAAAHPRQQSEPFPLETFMAEVESEIIKRALVQARGNKAEAARLLGMTRPRLYRRLEQLGFPADPSE